MRLAKLSYDQLTPEQRLAWDEVVAKAQGLADADQPALMTLALGGPGVHVTTIARGGFWENITKELDAGRPILLLGPPADRPPGPGCGCGWCADRRRVGRVPRADRDAGQAAIHPTRRPRRGPGRPRAHRGRRLMAASHATSPDRAHYQAVKQAHDGKLAAISMARKLARRCYHTLRNMDPEVVYAMPA